jgi:hypothetical protein
MKMAIKSQNMQETTKSLYTIVFNYIVIGGIYIVKSQTYYYSKDALFGN